MGFKDLTCVFLDYFCVLGYQQSYCETPDLSCVGLFCNKSFKIPHFTIQTLRLHSTALCFCKHLVLSWISRDLFNLDIY